MQKLHCIININGEILPVEKAKVSVMDHGFLYGDSVYETLRTIKRMPFQLGVHLDRLFRSAQRIALKSPLPKNLVRSEITQTLKRYWEIYPEEDIYIRVIISRGYGDIGFDPDLCSEPNLIVIAKKLIRLSVEVYEKGIPVASVSILRNNPRAIDPNIKSGNYLNNILAFQEAKKKNAVEAIMVNQDGDLTEGSTCNLFLVKDGTLFTPSADSGILEGLTRSLVIELAKKDGLALQEKKLPKSALIEADECFVSSSLKGVLGVTTCDGKKIGDGRVGHITKRLMTLLNDRIETALKEETCSQSLS